MKAFNMTVDLSTEEIIEAITEYVNKNVTEGLSASIQDVTVEVGTEYEDRPCGSSYPVLKGAKVVVKKMGAYADR